MANGDYVPKWKYDEAMDLGRTNAEAECLSDCPVKIRDLETRITNLSLQNEVLQNKLEQEKDGRCEEVADFQRESNTKITELENTLFRIKTLADYEKPF